MKRMVKHIDPKQLVVNNYSKTIFSIPENYNSIKLNIQKMGILEPITVIGNKVVNGNIRLKIALELGLKTVPVIESSNPQDDFQLLTISHAQHRNKTYSELLKEYETMMKLYEVKSGTRTDLNPELQGLKNNLIDTIGSKSKIQNLKKIKSLGLELYGEKSDLYKKMWEDIDTCKMSISKKVKVLESQKNQKINNEVFPQQFSLIQEKVKVYNKSCDSMTELSNESVSTIVTSPPYFKMRDYGTGKNQTGMEQTPQDYIKTLIKDMRECYRVLKQDGSLWVNISEPCIDGQYHCISHRFAMEMMKNGWFLRDEWIWVKNNPVFVNNKRSVRSHEYIFHFTKSNNYYYDTNWLSEIKDPKHRISMGSDKNVPKLLSGVDMRIGIVRTNTNDMRDLRTACEEKGFHLTHSAGFPLTIPLMCILTTSRVGDTILDCYSGTGTTGEASLMVGRNYVGYEVKPEFIKGTEVRISEYYTSKNMEYIEYEELENAA